MRGEVFRFRPRGSVGREQDSARFGIVVLSTRYLHLSTWLIVPTSSSAHDYVFRPRVTVLDKPTLALCDHVASVDHSQRLGDSVGFIARDEMDAVDEMLSALLELDQL